MIITNDTNNNYNNNDNDNDNDNNIAFAAASVFNFILNLYFQNSRISNSNFKFWTLAFFEIIIIIYY